jgi:hypothetical protein
VRITFRIIVIFLLIFNTKSVLAVTINVPGDLPTIQAGIDAASDGDMVMVADGNHKGIGNKNLDFKQSKRIRKRLTLIGIGVCTVVP